MFSDSATRHCTSIFFLSHSMALNKWTKVQDKSRGIKNNRTVLIKLDCSVQLYLARLIRIILTQINFMSVWFHFSVETACGDRGQHTHEYPFKIWSLHRNKHTWRLNTLEVHINQKLWWLMYIRGTKMMIRDFFIENIKVRDPVNLVQMATKLTQFATARALLLRPI